LKAKNLLFEVGARHTRRGTQAGVLVTEHFRLR
jgi:hypothetical protein